MTKPYDATSKALLELAPAAWRGLAGALRAEDKVTVIDADVSVVTAAADKVLYVADNPP